MKRRNETAVSALGNILGEQSYTLVDLGARGGADRVWSGLKEIVTFVFIEPDPSEAARLREERGSGTIVIEKAAWSESAVMPFYSLRNPSYSSLLLPDEEVLAGSYYFDRNFYEIDEVTSLQVDALGTLLEEAGVERLDFLKIDVQGAEMRILSSLVPNYMSGMQGLKTEAYGARLYQGATTIADLLAFGYANDLELFECDTIARTPLTSSCGERLFGESWFAARPHAGYRGRAMVFDLLLFPDRRRIEALQDPMMMRRAIFTACVCGYFDRAADLLIRGQRKGVISDPAARQLKGDILAVFKDATPLPRRLKETLKSRTYRLPIR